MLHLYNRTQKEIIEKKKELCERKKELENIKSYFGKAVMYKLVFEETFKRQSVGESLSYIKNKCAKYGDGPLVELIINSRQYDMVFDRYDKYVTGEYKTYDDISKLTPPPDFKNMVETFEAIVMDNAQSVFASLPQDIRKNNPEFGKLLRSTKKNYLYYYKDHQKKSFGLLFLEKDLPSEHD